jgi:molecular chaperone GrpE
MMKKHRKELEEKEQLTAESGAEEAAAVQENKVEQPAEATEVSQSSEEVPPENGKKEPTVEEKLAELQDKYLRLSAEFDNYRKRTLRERTDLIKSAGEDILTGILPVMDNMERGMAAMKDAKEPEAVKEGIALIYNKFKEFLQQRGVKEIEALNLDFNADLHEAVTKIPVQDAGMKGKVVDVLEKGYYLYDKIIRYSKVVVGDGGVE